MPPIAFITGVTGQDGSYLAEFLLSKGYIVHGMIRRASTFNTFRIDHLIKDRHENNLRFFFHHGEMTNTTSLVSLLSKIKPDEIYNLAAQSHVRVSFDLAEYTADCTGIGVLRLLEAIKICNLEKTVKLYQASSSEMFGDTTSLIQNEDTPFIPRSPYAISKLFAHHIVSNYREAYGIFGCNGIMFNHESPRRGLTFVTRKITYGVAQIYQKKIDCLYLGNLDAKRDWGHARDYVKVMWMMLQLNEPTDLVIGTGNMYSVREFVEKSFNVIGISITWSGEGIDEIGVNSTTGDIIIRIDPVYFRPTEVNHLCCDASKAKKVLNWTPSVTIDELIKEMVESDIENVKKGIIN